MLTGFRRNEILTLRWDDVVLDAGELRLRDGQTGARTVPLSPSALKLLAALSRVTGNPWVVPGRKPGTHMLELDGPWKTVRARCAHLAHDSVHESATRISSRSGADIEPEPSALGTAGTAASWADTPVH